MITYRVEEYVEGEYAIETAYLTFFGLTLFKYEHVSTDQEVINALSKNNNNNNIKGFSK